MLLPSGVCDKPGHPYCPEHQREMDVMERSDKDWNEILASHEAVCEEPKKKSNRLASCAIAARLISLHLPAG